MTAARKWTRVTKTNSCPICQKGDFCCTSGNLCLCMRVPSSRRSSCRLGGWLHPLDGPAEFSNHVSLKQEKPCINWGILARQMATDPQAAPLKASLATLLNVSIDSLTSLGVGCGKDEWSGLSFASWPERDETGKVVGIIRRYQDGSKKTMRHSSHGLYFVPGPEGPPVFRQGPIFAVEGGSDTAALLTLGLNVIGRPAAAACVGLLERLTAKYPNRLVIVGERDYYGKTKDKCRDGEDCAGCMFCWPGLAGATETARRIGAKQRRYVHVVVPTSKDVRSLINRTGISRNDFLRLAFKWQKRSPRLLDASLSQKTSP